MPSNSAIPPAMPSMTSVKEPRAMEPRKTSSMVLTFTMGTSGATLQTTWRTWVKRLSEPARSVRIRSEGTAGHGTAEDILHGPHFYDGDVRGHAPDHLADLGQEAFRTGPVRAHHVHAAALNELLVAPEIVHNHRPVDGGGGLLVGASVTDIAHHADDFAPRVLGALAYALAEIGRAHV